MPDPNDSSAGRQFPDETSTDGRWTWLPGGSTGGRNQPWL